MEMSLRVSADEKCMEIKKKDVQADLRRAEDWLNPYCSD